MCHIWGSSCFHILYSKSRQVKKQLLYSVGIIICTLGLSIIAFTDRSYSQKYSKSMLYLIYCIYKENIIFLKKEKESIRILQSLKINIYSLQAAQCVFSFSLERGNFIFKQCCTCLLNIGIFTWGKDEWKPWTRHRHSQGILTCLALGRSSVLRKKWMSSHGILLLVLLEGSTHLI